MRNSLILLSLVFSTLATLPAFHDKDENDDGKIDVDTILKALGTPQCMRKCIDPFIESTAALWDMKGVVNNTRKVCSSHSKALECLKRDSYCDVYKIFKTASASVESMCTKKYTMFEKFEKCLEPVADKVLQECDSQCYSKANLTAFSKDSNIQFAATVGGNIFIVSDHLGDICGSLACTLPCVTKKLNEKCSFSGWLTLDVLLKPLETGTSTLELLSEPIRDLMKQKLDKRCRFALDTLALNRIRNGDFTAFDSD